MTIEEAISYLENAVCELDAGIKIYSGTIKEEFIEQRECFTVALAALREPKQTNADRIRAMSDEELAKWLAEKLANQETMKLEEDGYTPTATQISALCARLTMVWLDWLKQEEHHEH